LRRNPLVPDCNARCTARVPTPQALVMVDAAMGNGRMTWSSGRFARIQQSRAADEAEQDAQADGRADDV